MSDSSCARQLARSSIFIVSESLFPLRSHGNVLPQSPLRVIVESTSWVGRFGRVTSYFDRGKQFEISSHNRFLFHCFLILDDARYWRSGQKKIPNFSLRKEIPAKKRVHRNFRTLDFRISMPPLGTKELTSVVPRNACSWQLKKADVRARAAKNVGP